MSARDRSGWPPHLRPGALRFGRASGHYDAVVEFYRDRLGLPVVDAFTASYGEDGTIFGLPDTGVQLEIVRGRGGALSLPDQVVFYLDDPEAVAAVSASLRGTGLHPVPDPHPYWAAAGAVLYRDPDGREVVLAPWVYGRDPDPTDGHGRPDEQAAAAETVGLEWYDGDRRALRPLFAEAEDSAEQLDSYLEDGRVLVARRGARIVGHLQLVPAGAGEVELKNMAVVAEERGTGIGRRLVETAISAVHGENISRMVVATAAADIGNLRFYQRCGFRMNRIERDAFTPGTGYPDPIVIDGIPLCDRVWLDQPLNPPTRP